MAHKCFSHIQGIEAGQGAVIMFWLDKSTRMEPKGCCVLVGWLVYLAITGC